MEYVHEQIEEAKAQLEYLEQQMYTIQRRYHVFEKQANELWKAGEDVRSEVLRPFAAAAGDDVWDAVLEIMDRGIDAHTYDACKNIIVESKLLAAFVKACPQIMAHKLQGDLCVKSRQCLLMNRRLNNLYMQGNRAIDSYHASTTTSSASSSSV